jgi:hypothetical protein
MIKTPQNNIYKVSNQNTVPSIAFTKNVNFDESGVIKQSSSLINIYDSSRVATFASAQDVISHNTDDIKILTGNQAFTLELDSLTVSEDTAAPDMDNESRFAKFENGDWLASTDNGIYEFSGTTWTRRNDDTVSFIESFDSRSTWVAVDVGNEVKQYAIANLDDSPLSTTSTGPDLILPETYNVSGVAYSNYKVGIATSDQAEDSAMFFTWDGTSASANTGTPVNAKGIMSVVAYLNSWVILTSRGELLYFNGGGWDILANLPIYHTKDIWVERTSSVNGVRQMQVVGDKIFILVGSRLEGNFDGSGVIPNFYSGVWCYDPAVGLYHRSSPCLSKYRRELLTETAGLYTTTTHYLETGDKIINASNVIYYVTKISDTTFKVAYTYNEAIASTNVDIGTQTFIWVERRDFGQLLFSTENTTLCKYLEEEKFSSTGFQQFYCGAELINTNLDLQHTLCLSNTKFNTISSIIYSRVNSSEIKDIYNSIIVKHRTLLDDDKIIIKYKLEDTYKKKAVSESSSVSPDRYVTWTDSNTFTFSNADYDASLVSVGDEVEIIAGQGSGQSAHVESISLSGGVWTVNIDENVRGVVATGKSLVMFDSFKKLGIITSSNSDGVFTAILNKTSKWCQIKLELRGVEVSIEELIINNKVHNPVL